MESRTDRVIQSLPPNEQPEARQAVEGLSGIFDGLDVGEFGKRMIRAAIDWVQAEVLPKVQERNSMLGLLLAGLLDALEGQLK